MSSVQNPCWSTPNASGRSHVVSWETLWKTRRRGRHFRFWALLKLKMAIRSWLAHQKWWFPIVMFVYQRVRVIPWCWATTHVTYSSAAVDHIHLFCPVAGEDHHKPPMTGNGNRTTYQNGDVVMKLNGGHGFKRFKPLGEAQNEDPSVVNPSSWFQLQILSTIWSSVIRLAWNNLKSLRLPGSLAPKQSGLSAGHPLFQNENDGFVKVENTSKSQALSLFSPWKLLLCL